jgi:hypothetical protein
LLWRWGGKYLKLCFSKMEHGSGQTH